MKSRLSSPRKLALFGVLAALCLAIQLTPRPPNVEFTSFLTFTVGVICGALDGAFFGCFIMFVNGFLSPYGFAGLNMPFQMFGMAIAGILGGVYRKLMPEQIDSARFCTETAIVGAVIALIFDLVTNVGVGFQLVLSGTNFALAMLTAIAYGVFFSMVHIFSNTAVFGILTLPSIKTLNNLVRGEKIG
jgi:hypothetical protein